MAKKTKHASLRSTTNTTVTIGNSNASVDPLVVSFPGGIPEGLTAATLDDSHAKKPQFIWKRLKEGKHKHGRALMGTDNACIYQSQSPKSALDDERKTKLCVGIYDKQTGKLILHQTAERGYVFAMNQSVKSYKDNSLSALPGHLTSLEQRRVLFESFGSQKKRKVLKSQETNIVNVDSVVGAGDLMMAAFGAQNMSESNRKAIEETQNGTKVGCYLYFPLYSFLSYPNDSMAAARCCSNLLLLSHIRWTPSRQRMQRHGVVFCRHLIPMRKSLILCTMEETLVETMVGVKLVVLWMLV